MTLLNPMTGSCECQFLYEVFPQKSRKSPVYNATKVVLNIHNLVYREEWLNVDEDGYVDCKSILNVTSAYPTTAIPSWN